uniref:Integrase, catalytic region, zinc finger, CCHC-type, peptidase aspartic, catalytic n=1 Tax=Tanacetum cinerariifolium TaxID=118510 RepID=A0A6L2MA27_TANCI|nr:integrase, catalytic region, zinc finger, CCHC-type, peptidase aspartic, catalytic [Tanacetum cinerariifolium]
MSTQQDIYAAGSENRPPMLNKDNYVPWSSHIIRYARSRPNGKMIVDSIENGPYVRRMIATTREPDLPVPVLESFHEQTDEELTENDIKWMDADDQAIQTILLGLPEDVYVTLDSCEIAKEIWEHVRQMMKGSDIRKQEKKTKLFNEWDKFTSTDGESIKSYYHRFMQLMNDLKRNKHFPKNIASNLKFLNNLQPEWKRHVTIFGQYAGQVAQNQQGYNAWQNGGIQVTQNACQNAGVQSGGNQNGLVVVPGIANQNGTGNVVAARAKGTGNGNQARCYNCIGLGIQLQAEEFDFMAATDRSAEVHLDDNCYDNKIFNMFTQDEHYTDLLEPIPEPQLVLQNDNHVTSIAPSMVQSGECEECKYDKISYDKAYNNMLQNVKSLQAQLRDFKGKSSDTPSASNTLDPLNQHLESKIVELEFQVVNYEREISHLKTTYKNLLDSITSNRVHAKLHNLIYENDQLRARVFENTSESMNNTSGMSVTPHVHKPKLSAVTPHSKKLHASIPSHSVPEPREFNVMKHRNVIALVMFKINPSQTSRVYLVPNKQSRLVHTVRTRRPQPKGNIRNARAPSASKSSEVKKNVIVEDHRRTLLLSKNQKTMSFECNNINLAIQNDKSEIVCDTCKQCLVTANHDTCFLFSVNALNSRANNMCANVPLSENQKRHRTQVWKPKQVGSKERLAYMVILNGEILQSPRRNNCFIRDLDGVDLLKGNRSINLYIINLYDIASASPICLMACATPTNSWVWHQRLSYLNFDTINDLAKNDLVSSLPKFKYAKEHLCPSCKQGKRKKASQPPKPIMNLKQRPHLLHMDLCGLMRVITLSFPSLDDQMKIKEKNIEDEEE